MIAGQQDVAEQPILSTPRSSLNSVTMYEQFTDDCLSAIELWLQWDERNRHLTERLFEARGDQCRLEELLDECEALRRQAADISRRALARLDGPSTVPTSTRPN